MRKGGDYVSFWKPDPKKGEYDDLKPANTQIHAYGKDFVDGAAKRNYARIMGKTKPCPSCLNSPSKRYGCSTCGGKGEVDINFGVF